MNENLLSLLSRGCAYDAGSIIMQRRAASAQSDTDSYDCAQPARVQVHTVAGRLTAGSAVVCSYRRPSVCSFVAYTCRPICSRRTVPRYSCEKLSLDSTEAVSSYSIFVLVTPQLARMSPCRACQRGCYEETAAVEFQLNSGFQVGKHISASQQGL